MGAILIAVANLNAFIEFYQRQKSQKILESFLNMIPAKSMCLRDGKLAQIDASSLVPGDVVFNRMGDKTPADILIFAAWDCKVDNSSLTGESSSVSAGWVPSTTGSTFLNADKQVRETTASIRS